MGEVHVPASTAAVTADTSGAYTAPQTDEELAWQLRAYFGLSFPSVASCPGHTAPFQALADAYFARYPTMVIHASRSFGGKTTLLGGLSIMEVIAGFDVALHAGSGGQSRRTYQVSQRAWSHRGIYRQCAACEYIDLEDEEWCAACGVPMAEGTAIAISPPLHLLESEPTRMFTRMKAGNVLEALPASSKAARSPHPQRLRVDEVDELTVTLLDTILAQALSDPARKAQVVLASTRQYEAGAMTETLKRAGQNGWPVYRWCYLDTLVSQDNPGSWLLHENITEMRTRVTGRTWRVEMDLQAPDSGGTIFGPEVIASLFGGAEEVPDDLNRYYEWEPPTPEGSYVTAADWGRKTDLAVVATLRTDMEPIRLVALQRFYRAPWQASIGHFNERAARYGGLAIHDATGLGDVVAAYLDVPEDSVIDYIFTSASKAAAYLNYEGMVEQGKLRLPPLESLIEVHRYLQRGDLYGTGHPPDEIAALALGMMVAANRARPVGGGRMFMPRTI